MRKVVVGPLWVTPSVGCGIQYTVYFVRYNPSGGVTPPNGLAHENYFLQAFLQAFFAGFLAAFFFATGFLATFFAAFFFAAIFLSPHLLVSRQSTLSIYCSKNHPHMQPIVYDF
jgi:hypothetical protein